MLICTAQNKCNGKPRERQGAVTPLLLHPMSRQTQGHPLLLYFLWSLGLNLANKIWVYICWASQLRLGMRPWLTEGRERKSFFLPVLVQLLVHLKLCHVTSLTLKLYKPRHTSVFFQCFQPLSEMLFCCWEAFHLWIELVKKKCRCPARYA